MLTEDQRWTFDTLGWVRLPGAFSPVDAARMAERVWEALARLHGFRRESPETWTVARPTGFQNLARVGAFDALLTPELCEAIDGLLGAGTWDKPVGGGTPLIAFPRSATAAWEVPTAAWHLDFPARGELTPAKVARAFALIAPVVPRGGGTLVLEGSHALIARLAAAGNVGKGSSAEVKKALVRADPWLRELFVGGDPEGRTRHFLETGASVEGVDLRVAELTGDAGDAIFMHPQLLHAPSSSAARQPRMLVSHSIFCRRID